MSGITIYMEGGGNKANSKAMLRTGMDAFLAEIKNACREKNWHWNLVPCGSRDEAYKRFRNVRENNIRANEATDILVLLVDSEDPVGKSVKPTGHLTARDGWDLHGVNDDYIHLMVQAMEAWIVADPDAVGEYYGQGFKGHILPRRRNLEEENKDDIEDALDQATQGTQKGKYHKIKHARHLLQCIDPTIVRKRCPHCKRLFETLLCLIP